MEKLQKSTNVIEYSLNYTNNTKLHEIAGAFSILFLVIFGVMFWTALRPEPGTKNSIIFFRWVIVISLIWPINAIMQYSFLRS